MIAPARWEALWKGFGLLVPAHEFEALTARYAERHRHYHTAQHIGECLARFEEYEQQVREEYAWVPDFLFRRTRGKILQGFLARQAIYATAHFHDRLEKKARENLARSIVGLSLDS